MKAYCGANRRVSMLSVLAAGALFALPALASAQLTGSFETVNPDPREHMVNQLTLTFSQQVVNLTLDEILLQRPAQAPVGLHTFGGVTLTNPLADGRTFVIGNLGSTYSIPGLYAFSIQIDDLQGFGGAPLTNSPEEQFRVFQDVIPDGIEQAAPNGGDGNFDGVPDFEQPNVVSFPQDDDGDYMTVRARLGTFFSIANHIPSGSEPGAVPLGVSFPEGLVHFTVENLFVGETTQVVVRYHAPEQPAYNNWYKTDNVGTAYLPFTNITYTPGGGQFRATLTLTDGGIGDNDGVANGIIDDPSGPTNLVLAVDLVSLEAVAAEGGVNVNWETASEIDSAGFSIYRAVATDGEKYIKGELLTSSLIAAEGAVGVGASYTFFDAVPLASGEERHYFLVELETDGDLLTYGPISATKSLQTTNVPEWAIYQ